MKQSIPSCGWEGGVEFLELITPHKLRAAPKVEPRDLGRRQNVGLGLELWDAAVTHQINPLSFANHSGMTITPAFFVGSPLCHST